MITKRLKVFARWIGTNAAIIVAMSSVLIACLSLYFTIQAQQADLQYKEVAIAPRMWLGAEEERMSVSLRNNGLGPAIIEQVDIVSEGKCLSSGDMSREAFSEVYTSFLKGQLDKLYTKTLPEMPWFPGGRRNYDTDIRYVGPGDVIRAGESEPLVKLAEGSLIEYRQANSAYVAQANQKFSQAAYELPIRFLICSATRRTCGVIGQPVKECD